jgi:hypothetical protein
VVVNPFVCGVSLERLPIFSCVETIGVFATSNTIFALMLKILLAFGGLKLKELGGKLVNMGCNGNNMF